jgi:predicted metal-dependent phosphotriesterase family hydrolase
VSRKQYVFLQKISRRGYSVSIHCHILEAKIVLEVIQVLDAENADYHKFLWAHTDKEAHKETVKLAAEKGMWMGIDIIRKGTSPEKFELLSYVISLGYGHKVLLSQDYDFYSEATKSIEDHPCTVIFDEFIPYCSANGIAKQEIIRMMTENPANFYDVDTIRNLKINGFIEETCAEYNMQRFDTF